MNFKQRNIPWVGAFIEALFNTLPMLSIMNFISIIIVLYASIRPYLIEHAPWMKLWIFILILTALSVIVMILIYKYVLSSLWAFRGKQMFQNENKIIEKLDKLEEKIDRLANAK